MANAAVVDAAHAPFVLQDVEVAALSDDEVRIKIAAVGVCHTDLGARAGAFPTPLPAVLGHEGAGTVLEVGSAVTHVTAGDRVVLSYDSCGHCATCVTGGTPYCREFLPRNFLAARLDGSTAFSRDGHPLGSHFFGQSSFATETISPARSVVRIDSEIPFEVLAPFGCGVQTGAGAVMRSLRPPAGSTIAIFGAGGVGMSAILAAQIVGCDTIIAVDLHPDRLALAAELGATHTINGGDTDAVEEIASLTGAGADFTLECTGVPAVLSQAVGSLAPTGTCGVVGAPPFGSTANIDVNAVLSMGRRIQGIVEGDSLVAQFIPQLVEFWRQGRLPVERFITTFDFDQINDAVAQAESGATVKPVLRVS